MGSTDDGLLCRHLLAFNFFAFSFLSLHPFRVQTGLCELDLSSSPELYLTSACCHTPCFGLVSSSDGGERMDQGADGMCGRANASCDAISPIANLGPSSFQVPPRRTPPFIGMGVMRRSGIHIETST